MRGCSSPRPVCAAWYGGTSAYLWWDAEGRRHEISQGDGCEQGDALVPALYALAQHDALAAAQGRLEPGEFLAAFLDDLYLVTTPARARPALDDVTRTVERHAGVAANFGKTRVYRANGGPPPPDVEALGPDVWSEVTASRRLAALLCWACRSGIRSSCDAFSRRDSKKSAAYCRNCQHCWTCRERGCSCSTAPARVPNMRCAQCRRWTRHRRPSTIRQFRQPYSTC